MPCELRDPQTQNLLHRECVRYMLDGLQGADHPISYVCLRTTSNYNNSAHHYPSAHHLKCSIQWGLSHNKTSPDSCGYHLSSFVQKYQIGDNESMDRWFLRLGDSFLPFCIFLCLL